MLLIVSPNFRVPRSSWTVPTSHGIYTRPHTRHTRNTERRLTLPHSLQILFLQKSCHQCENVHVLMGLWRTDGLWAHCWLFLHQTVNHQNPVKAVDESRSNLSKSNPHMQQSNLSEHVWLRLRIVLKFLSFSHLLPPPNFIWRTCRLKEGFSFLQFLSWQLLTA